MRKRRSKIVSSLPKRVGTIALSLSMVLSSLQVGTINAEAAEELGTWKGDVTAAMDELTDAMDAADDFAEAQQNLQDAYDGLESAVSVDDLAVVAVGEDYITLQWSAMDLDNLAGYNVYWADKNLDTTKFQLLGPDGTPAEGISGNLDENGKKITPAEMTLTKDDVKGKDVIEFKVNMSTFKNLYFKVAIVTPDGAGTKSEAVESPTAVEYEAIMDELGRGLIAVQKTDGVYLSWRLLGDEVDGDTFEDESGQGLTGLNFNVYRNDEKIATVSNSTNYLDTAVTEGLTKDMYSVVPVDAEGKELTEQKAGIYQVLTADSANSNAAYLQFNTYAPKAQTLKEIYGIDSAILSDVNTSITYTLNDASTADVDGDGEYEIIVKWSPSQAQDVSIWGYTGKQMVDCYKIDGTLLWRVDLGVNIRAGAHYTQHIVFDFEGDGQSEMLLKTAPGTKIIQYELDENGQNVMEDTDGDGTPDYPKVANENYITIPEEDVAEGVTNEDNYVMSQADYREHLIEMFMDWGIWADYTEESKKAIDGYWSGNLVDCFTVSAEWGDTSFYTEGATTAPLDIATMSTEDIQEYVPGYEEGDKLVVVCTTVPTTHKVGSTERNPNLKVVKVEDVVNYSGNYDLSSVDKDVTGVGYTREEATLLADYFLNHFGYTNYRHKMTEYEGFILDGPEYVTLFDAKTGAELDTQEYLIGREDDGLIWGDYGWRGGMEPGNRVDRFNGTVVYLDGETPTAVFGRGYYTRTTFTAWNVVDGKLVLVDTFDTGAQPMTNPFNDNGAYKNGVNEDNGKMSGQGQHYIAAADVDLDGRQELVNGGGIVKLDEESGKLVVYSAGGDYIGGDESKGWKKHYHGDMMHITDIDPDLPGIEVASCFEGGSGPWDWAVRSLYTNNTLFGSFSGSDVARFTIGDTNPDLRGIEVVGGGMSADGKLITVNGSTSSNHSLKWSADMTTQFVTGGEGSNVSIIGEGKTWLTASGYTTCNSTKGNPSLTADLFGDYREELLVRSMNSDNMRIYFNTEVSDRKNYTPMHNLQYRAQVAGQQSAYNIPSYVDYYYAYDTDWEYVTIPNVKKQQEAGPVVTTPTDVKLNVTSATMYEGDTLKLKATVLPMNANQTVTWSSNNTTVATVDENGLVTAVGGGVAAIVATTDNNLTAECVVTVIANYVEEEGNLKVGDSITYKFGTGVTAAEGQVAVTSESIFSEETGYGWQTLVNVELTDGADYVAGNNVRTTDDAGIVTWEYPTFSIDVPVGVYEVKIVQGTNGTESAVNGAYIEGYMYASRWSSVNFGTSYDEPAEDSWIYTQAGQTQESTTTVAVPDGVIDINLATSLTNEGVSGTTYVKEIVITRLEQNTEHSAQPTLRFIGDSTLAKYPPTDDGTWTPIPERTGWGEEFSMGRFVDDSVVLVNKAVAGSSLKSYIYDGYYNDFFLNSNPGDTVIIESGINDSASGRRYSSDEEFEEGLRYLIESCESFGLNVILSSGTSSASNYVAKMESLATEFNINYVALANMWGSYTASHSGHSFTVDGTHLNRIGGIVAAQLVANTIANYSGLSISGHVIKTDVAEEAPTKGVTGLYVQAQTEGSVTLAWNIAEEDLYDYNQLINGFNVYRKVKGGDKFEKVATQTAYVSAGMSGPQMYTTLPVDTEDTYIYYVTTQGVNGEGPATAELTVPAFVPTAAYTVNKYAEQFDSQLYDASVYTTESYVAVKKAILDAQSLLASGAANADVEAAIAVIEEKIAALQFNAAEIYAEDFQKEALASGAWGAEGSNKSFLSCVMETTGNRMLNLYVEAAGSRTVYKSLTEAADVEAAVQMLEFEWYPGNVDNRNVTEVEFYAGSDRVISLKTASNGHIGYVVGNYPTDSTAYMQGTGFHDYEGSRAVDLGLSNEAWYKVKLVVNFAENKADLYVTPRDAENAVTTVVNGIVIDETESKTIDKINWLLARGKNDAGGNDLSILLNSNYDNFGMYYAAEENTVDTTEYEAAAAAYTAKIAGLGSSALSADELVLAELVIDAMRQDVGFNTVTDYAYAVSVLEAATNAAPTLVPATSVEVKADGDDTSVLAGLSTELTAVLSDRANEEVVWSSSDETVAVVEPFGESVSVTTLKAGEVTITAKGATSGVEGSIVLNVTGDVYWFGSDVTATSAYNEETGFGFMDYTYPEAAKGWVNGIYYDRDLVEKPGVSYISAGDSSDDYLAVIGQVWTELPEGGRDEDTITYENTDAFVLDAKNGNYNIGVTFVNPTATDMEVMVKAEDIRRYDYGDHETSQIGLVTVPAGETAEVEFALALTDGQITLRFEQTAAAASADTAAARKVYVQSVSVEQTYEAIDLNPAKPWIFDDLEQSGDWRHTAVKYVYQYDYMSGVSDTEFAPDDTMTRPMFVQTLYNMEGEPKVKTGDNFIDVTDADWFAKAVAWAFQTGVTSGISDNEFGSLVEITREQLVTLMYNYATIKGYDTTAESGLVSTFVDADEVSDWAVEAIEWAVSHDIISGMPLADGSVKFAPQVPASRVQCATIIMGFCENIVNASENALAADEEEAGKVTIFTAGDSTVQTYIKENYRNGWAQVLYTLFGDEVAKEETDTGYAYYETEDTIIKNYARDARSAKSFLEEGRLNEVLLGLSEGDYVFVQFAHNDDNQARPNRFLSVPEYKEYLKAYNNAIAERGATLVLVTPIVINSFDESGELDHRFDDYRLAMLELGESLDIPVLDLMGSSYELISSMGAENVAALSLYMNDTVHTAPAGAKLYAGLLGNQIQMSDNEKLAAVKELMNTEATDNFISLSCDEIMYVSDNGNIEVSAPEGVEYNVYTSDSSVVEIQGNKLVAKAPGTAIITAGYTVGDTATVDCTSYTDYATVIVTDDPYDTAFLVDTRDDVVAETVTVKNAQLNAEGDNESETEGKVSAVTVYADADKEGMMPSPLTDYVFDLGTKNGAAPSPFKSVTTAYDAETGYGWLTDVGSITFDRHGDSAPTFDVVTDYDMAFQAALTDGARAGEWEFAIDLPAGEYYIAMYAHDTWNGASANAKYYINDVEVGTYSYVKGEAHKLEDVTFAGRVVLTEDSQVVCKGVKGSSTLNYINAITVCEYVERVDAYNEDAWKAVDAAVTALQFKADFFEDDSTPFDYDAVLVTRMVAARDALEDVMYMDSLVDTTEGDALYALAEQAMTEKYLYADATVEKLEAAMAPYVEAKNALDVREQVKAAKETLDFWLLGVGELETEPYTAYFDFNTTQTGGSSYNDALAWEAAGWIPVGVSDGHPSADFYSAETGYGIMNANGGRNRGNADLMLTDFAFAGTNFKIDLKAGTYNVVTYSADINSGCKAASQFDFYTGYTDAENTGTNLLSFEKITASEAGTVMRTGSFTLEEDATVTVVNSGYMNGLIFEEVVDLEVERYDVTELAELVSEIADAGLKEEEYTISTYSVFLKALTEAQAAVEAGASYAQQVESVKSNLEEAYAGLVKRVATEKYALDFGPEAEDEETPGKVSTWLMLSSYLPTGVSFDTDHPELGLGTMLYATNTDDNGMHYGFTEEVNTGFTTSGGNYFRDWAYSLGGSEYTFKADVPVGKYYVYVYTGDKTTANVTKFYFNDGKAAVSQPATETATPSETDDEGRTVYTQSSSAGGQYDGAASIYLVEVKANADALSSLNGTTMGTFSITCFNDDETLADTAITARLCGLELIRVGDLNVADRLEIAIAQAEAVNTERYTPASVEALTTALTNARNVTGDASADDILALVEALESAIAKMTLKADKDVLVSMIEGAEASYWVIEEMYTEESWTAYAEALALAKAVAANENATQNDVNAITLALSEVQNGLVALSGEAQLAAAVLKADVIHPKSYEQNAESEFYAATYAEACLAEDNSDMTDTQKAELARELLGTIANLKADMTELGIRIANAEAKLSTMDEAKKAEAEALIEAAKEVYNQEDATVEQISVQLDNLADLSAAE